MTNNQAGRTRTFRQGGRNQQVAWPRHTPRCGELALPKSSELLIPTRATTADLATSIHQNRSLSPFILGCNPIELPRFRRKSLLIHTPDEAIYER